MSFNEIIRRIPAPKQMIIVTKLEQVTDSQLALLNDTIADQHHLLADGSFIHDNMFPFVALEAVRRNTISAIQFGTLMTLWGSLDSILPRLDRDNTCIAPEFFPLFTTDGKRNQRTSDLLISTLSRPSELPNLIFISPKALLNRIYEKAINLPASEQGLWIVAHNMRAPVGGVTITQAIKALGIRFLALDANDAREMVPSFGLLQLFLNEAFPHAVRLNPVLGKSTPKDIRAGDLARYRDIAIPFPDNELPKMAHQFPTPLALDFMFHDRYHAIRASRVTPQETAHYVAIGDKVEEMQIHYHGAVKECSKRHKEHLQLFSFFRQAIKKAPIDKQNEALGCVLKKLYREKAIIHKLKTMGQSTGQLKFLLWDMELNSSGTCADIRKETPLKELSFIVSNIETDLNLLGKMANNNVALSRYSARRVAHAVLDVVKPNAAVLRALQDELRKALLHYSSDEELPCTEAFLDTIMNAPAGCIRKL